MNEKPPISGKDIDLKQNTFIYFSEPRLYSFLDFCHHLLALWTVKEVCSLTAFFTKTFVDVPFCQVYIISNGKIDLVDGFPTAAQTTGEFSKYIDLISSSLEFQMAALQQQPYIVDLDQNQNAFKSINIHFQEIKRIILIPLVVDEKLLGLLVFR